ncbi:MAG TPA: hypothetical protein VFT57_17585 [Gemmatimonadaceae bacterium]|nr:hypothetical protein [Gemmatimonadaceae bacterium]
MMKLGPSSRIASVLLMMLAAAALACSEGDASESTADGRTAAAGSPAAAAPKEAEPVDSAILLARAATEHWQEVCESDSAAIRHSEAVAAADRAAADSARAADSVHAVLLDSLSRDTTRAARTKLASLKAKQPAGKKDPPAWAGKVARRAMSQTPLPGSLFPGCRVVAYYGNPLSRRMGILGEIAPDSMLARLARQAAAYQKADPSTHVVPALELIAIVAQANAGRDGLYRARMPDTLIERVASWAEEKGYILILDIQNGHSEMAREISSLVPFLKRPNVHLALDPEFSMPGKKRPGTVIGTLDAREVNQAVDTLSRLVKEHELPPKMLIVHRFTKPMLTNQEKIRLDPRVQVVIDMDGFGAPFLKRDSYRRYVFEHPVQFTGFKIFYKNDKPMLTPEEVMKLVPVPVFIMYQ